MRKLLVSVFALMAVVAFQACGSDDGGKKDPEKDIGKQDNGDVGCTEVCAGKECGTVEGCECGTCGEGFTCVANACLDDSDPCVLACADLDCGAVEDCASCGTCGEGFTCTANLCVKDGLDCTQVCEGKECGTVQGCPCGTCADGTECNPTTNKCDCVPVCVDEETGDELACGDDGCGGSCGTCEFGECVEHACVCEPACTGKDCGPDGCGGTCGQCGEGLICQVSTGECKDACVKTDITFAGDFVQKLNYMDIGAGGFPGEALDIDNDPNTCSPAGNCSDGINNQLSGLLSQLSSFVDVTEELSKAIAGGDVILLAEPDDWNTTGTEFLVQFYLGKAVDETCDLVNSVCDYLVDPMSFDDITCEAIISFDNAVVNGTAMTAGGPAYKFTVAIPITEGAPPLSVTADFAHVVATVNGEGDAMTWTGGLIGGAIRKDTIMAAVDNLPPGLDLPVSPAMIKNLLNTFIVPDIDTDDDGELDAASIGIKFTTLAGKITGLEVD